MSGPAISVCMTTARPYAWRLWRDVWLSNTRRQDLVEFVVFFSERHGFDAANPPETDGVVPIFSGGAGRRVSAVYGWNAAARASQGQLLLMVHDDMLPPKNWDVAMLKDCLPIQDEWAALIDGGNGDYEIPILTRQRFERLGHVFFPRYQGDTALREFYMRAELDTIVEAGPILRPSFRHYSPKYGDGLWDDVHAARAVDETALFKQRESMGFPDEEDESFDLRWGRPNPDYAENFESGRPSNG